MTANLAPLPTALDERKFYAAIRVLPSNVVDKIVFDKATSCWRWVASTQPNGYGRVWDGERLQYAHRLVYAALLFKIKPGFDLGFLCPNRDCTNPEHMEQVTRSETIKRGGSYVGIAQTMRDRVQCPHGHAYDAANTHVRNGRRHCRTCARDRYHRNKSPAQIAA